MTRENGRLRSTSWGGAGLAAAVAVVLLAGSLAAEAQPRRRAQRVGYLSHDALPSLPSKSFVEGMRELGYVEGRDFRIEYRTAEAYPDRLPSLANDLVRSGVDVLVTQGTAATLAAKEATRTVPIVFGSAGFPVEKGIVASLARPGGNITGLAIHVGPSKALELLKEAAPKLVRVVHLYDAATVQPAEFRETTLKGFRSEADALGIKLQSIALRGPGEVGRAFGKFQRATNGLILDNAGQVLTNREDICRRALKRRLPSIGRARAFADAGCLLSYGEDIAVMYRRAAAHVDRILKGARPGEIPIEQSAKFNLVVNLKAAKQLGLTIPPSLMLRANQLIE